MHLHVTFFIQIKISDTERLAKTDSYIHFHWFVFVLYSVLLLPFNKRFKRKICFIIFNIIHKNYTPYSFGNLQFSIHPQRCLFFSFLFPSITFKKTRNHGVVQCGCVGNDMPAVINLYQVKTQNILSLAQILFVYICSKLLSYM